MPSLTINYSIENGQRVAAAIGTKLGLGQSATAEEVKQFIIDRVKRIVLDMERVQAQEAVNVDTLDIT